MVRPRCRCSRRTSLAERESAGRSGESPARHSNSSAIRLPMPATRDWSSSRAFKGTLEPRSAAASADRLMVAASGPSPGHVRIEHHAAQAPRIADHQGATVVEPGRPPDPLRVAAAGGRRRAGRCRHPRRRRGCRSSRTGSRAVGPLSISSSRSFPIRRAETKRCPSRARRRDRASVPPFRNQESGVASEAIVRNKADSASRR